MVYKLRRIVPLAVAFLLIGLLSSPLPAGPEPKVVMPVERSYYLTVGTYQGDSTKTACALGYHFASILELVAWKEMVYNTDLGVTDDDREGPPNNEYGWVRGRSGNDQSNCYDWTWNQQTPPNGGGSAIGDLAQLSVAPILTDPNASPWTFYGPFAWCSRSEHVWCVSDSLY